MSQVASSISTEKAAPLSWVESLFGRMQAIYGNKFADLWRDTDIGLVKSVWSAEMGKLNPDDLRRGVAGLMTREWPPTLPEFIKLCRPPIDMLAAYYQAVAGVTARERGELGEWPSPAVYWAAVEVGAFDLKTQTYAQIRQRWESALQAEISKGTWDAIPMPALALPAPGKVPQRGEEADRMLKQVKASGFMKEKADHKAWAVKILGRYRAGDKSITQMQVDFAKEALAA